MLSTKGSWSKRSRKSWKLWGALVWTLWTLPLVPSLWAHRGSRRIVKRRSELSKRVRSSIHLVILWKVQLMGGWTRKKSVRVLQLERMCGSCNWMMWRNLRHGSKTHPKSRSSRGSQLSSPGSLVSYSRWWRSKSLGSSRPASDFSSRELPSVLKAKSSLRIRRKRRRGAPPQSQFQLGQQSNSFLCFQLVEWIVSYSKPRG